MRRNKDAAASARPSVDLDALQAHASLLVGQPLLVVRVSYGDELTLHFGAGAPDEHPKLSHVVHGSFVLGSRASAWRLTGANRLDTLNSDQFAAAVDDHPRAKDELVARLMEMLPAGMRVVAAKVTMSGRSRVEECFQVAVSFENGAVFEIEPIEADPELADWELFCPNDKLLEAGPGSRWSYRSSIEPA